ncbi:MAG: ECF transporter S component [Oscillospiraceae bacterium]|nr:ECF transporter S component [Oscillospiraceae bacterium]
MSKEESKKEFSTKELVLTALLTAVVVLMAFTPLGYLKIGLLSISFLMIPVAIGAISVGWKTAALLGTVFGITSFVQCFGMDAFGTFLFGLNPFFTFVMCVVTRAIAGALAGLIAKITKRAGRASYAITGVGAALCNTVLFVGALSMLFWNNASFRNFITPRDESVSATTAFSFSDTAEEGAADSRTAVTVDAEAKTASVTVSALPVSETATDDPKKDQLADVVLRVYNAEDVDADGKAKDGAEAVDSWSLKAGEAHEVKELDSSKNYVLVENVSRYASTPTVMKFILSFITLNVLLEIIAGGLLTFAVGCGLKQAKLIK